MHAYGFYMAILLSESERRSEARRRLPDEPLPPIDDATVLAWRAWAASDRMRSADARHRAASLSGRTASTRADQPA